MDQLAGAASQGLQPIAGGAAERQPVHAGRIVISCYQNDVPGFVEDELRRLYGSVYSSLAQFRIYYRGGDVSTYIVREKDKIRTIFLFSVTAGRVRVVNEVFGASEEDIGLFARHIFSTMPEAQAIAFKSIWTDMRRLPYPFLRANHLEDYVVSLPATAEEYLAGLSGSTRRKIKRKTEKLEQDFPSFRFEVHEAPAIDEDMLRKVIALNHVRMATKNKLSKISSAETERMIRLARECGMVTAVLIDGQVCAGAVAFRSGSGYFLNVIAHDPAYDEYWLGTLCCYWTVSHSIATRAREFHFLWGRYDYKQMLLGAERSLDNVEIYRSRATMFRHAAHVFRFAMHAARRRAQLWLYYARRDNKLSGRFVFSCLQTMRKIGWVNRYG